MERANVLESNRLLALLPSGAIEMMLPHVSIAPLSAGAALSDDVYFVLSGLVSMFVPTSEGQVLHTGLVGKDGAVGLTWAWTFDKLDQDRSARSGNRRKNLALDISQCLGP
jgi:hypothetical protein